MTPFFCIHISQGSVVTCYSVVEYLNMNLVSCFLTHSVQLVKKGLKPILSCYVYRSGILPPQPLLIVSLQMTQYQSNRGNQKNERCWLVGNAVDVGISDKVMPVNVQDSL